MGQPTRSGSTRSHRTRCSAETTTNTLDEPTLARVAASGRERALLCAGAALTGNATAMLVNDQMVECIRSVLVGDRGSNDGAVHEPVETGTKFPRVRLEAGARLLYN